MGCCNGKPAPKGGKINTPAKKVEKKKDEPKKPETKVTVNVKSPQKAKEEVKEVIVV